MGVIEMKADSSVDKKLEQDGRYGIQVKRREMTLMYQSRFAWYLRAFQLQVSS